MPKRRQDNTSNEIRGRARRWAKQLRKQLDSRLEVWLDDYQLNTPGVKARYRRMVLAEVGKMFRVNGFKTFEDRMGSFKPWIKTATGAKQVTFLTKPKIQQPNKGVPNA